jgi:hypothetical protein
MRILSVNDKVDFFGGIGMDEQVYLGDLQRLFSLNIEQKEGSTEGTSSNL